jgi:C4-dicarboxylate-specific signal transduction histidine kinase
MGPAGWIQLNKVIEDELQFFDANNVFKYEVEKRIHLDDELPLVWANPLHMQQIIDNLVHNALDAMAQSQAKQLSISTYCEKNYVCMSVADTGAGIDAQILPLIFLNRILPPSHWTKARGLGWPA